MDLFINLETHIFNYNCFRERPSCVSYLPCCSCCCCFISYYWNRSSHSNYYPCWNGICRNRSRIRYQDYTYPQHLKKAMMIKISCEYSPTSYHYLNYCFEGMNNQSNLQNQTNIILLSYSFLMLLHHFYLYYYYYWYYFQFKSVVPKCLFNSSFYLP